MSHNTSKPVSNSVSRRQLLLRGIAVSAGGTAILIAASTPAEAKMPQKGVHYQTTPKGNASCSNCDHFQPPSSCALVESPISPKGWCSLYTKKA